MLEMSLPWLQVPGWDDNVKSAAAVASVPPAERCFRVCGVACHAQVTLNPLQARRKTLLALV